VIKTFQKGFLSNLVMVLEFPLISAILYSNLSAIRLSVGGKILALILTIRLMHVYYASGIPTFSIITTRGSAN
jgi:hypothetical protein